MSFPSTVPPNSPFVLIFSQQEYRADLREIVREELRRVLREELAARPSATPSES
jgi:hypothetical protein